MARYSANSPSRTLTVHKDGCREVGRAAVGQCGCGSTSARGNSRWFCEAHVSVDAVADFMGGRFWAMLPCGRCFGTAVALFDANDGTSLVAEPRPTPAGKDVVVVRLVTEGGGVTVLGREEWGKWRFRAEGGTIDDEAENDWREWETGSRYDLMPLLPSDWPLFFPLDIHPAFITWFRDRYAGGVEALRPELRKWQEGGSGREWQRFFAAGGDILDQS